MATLASSPHYSRRYNDDEGVVESICRYCHRTIANGREEKRLSLHEEIPSCVPKLLAADQIAITSVYAGDQGWRVL